MKHSPLFDLGESLQEPAHALPLRPRLGSPPFDWPGWAHEDQNLRLQIRSFGGVIHSMFNRAYDLGANSYLAKPSSASGYVELAEKLRGYWLELNHPPDGAGES